VSVFERLRHALGRFTDDLKIAHNRILGLAISKKAFFPGCGVFENVLNGVSDVQKVDTVVLYKGTASAWMCCSM
jgi:hypothetical protein